MSLSIFISSRPSKCFAFLYMSVFNARWETRWRIGEGVCEIFRSFFKFLRVLVCLKSVFSDGQDVKHDRDITPQPHHFHGINPFHVYSPFPTSDPRSYPIHEVSQFEYLCLMLDPVRHRSRTRVASLIWGFFSFCNFTSHFSNWDRTSHFFWGFPLLFRSDKVFCVSTASRS